MIQVRHDGPVSTVLLDRPDRRNALTPAMLTQFVTILSSPAESARCIVLAGEGQVFCSGFDLALCQANPDGTVMKSLLSGLFDAISALRRLPIPVVAAVQGAAIAGGCALLGGTDFVISHPDAKFGYPVLALGVSPAVSAPSLSTAIGAGPTRERQLDTALISGREAFRLGLVTESVPQSDQVRPRALALAAELAAKPAAGIRATRAWLLELEQKSFQIAEGRALEVSLSLAGGTEEQARLASFARRGG